MGFLLPMLCIVGGWPQWKATIVWTDLFSLILTRTLVGVPEGWTVEMIMKRCWEWTEPGSTWVEYITLSSAYSAICVSGHVGWSSEYRLNSFGDATAPLGTLAKIGEILASFYPDPTPKCRSLMFDLKN